MSFAPQASSIERLAKHGRGLENKVYSVPLEIDRMVAELKLKFLGVGLEKLTGEQVRYLRSW